MKEVKIMNMPGFTAEASLEKREKAYRQVRSGRNEQGSGSVHPSTCHLVGNTWICDVAPPIYATYASWYWF